MILMLIIIVVLKKIWLYHYSDYGFFSSFCYEDDYINSYYIFLLLNDVLILLFSRFNYGLLFNIIALNKSYYLTECFFYLYNILLFSYVLTYLTYY